MTVESVEAVEVKAEDTQMTEVSVSLPEEEKAVEKVNEAKPKTVEKSSSYREESNFLSDLKDNENKALIELRSKLEEAILRNTLFKKEELKKETASESKEEQPAAAERKRRSPKPPMAQPQKKLNRRQKGKTSKAAAKWRNRRRWWIGISPCGVNEAFEMLKKTLEWRKEFKTDSILEEELGQDISSVAYMNGVDREGHPICYNIYGVLENQELYQKTFGTEEKRNQFLRWRIQLMEKGIQKLDFKPGGVTSLLQINDLSNSPGPSKKEIRIATKQAVGLLQDNYPEFVARNIFINVPFWYYALNALLSPFLTQRTKSKFVFVRPSKVTETLLKYICVEEIPAQYGGLKREKDTEFSIEDGGVTELVVKAGSTETIEIPVPEVGTTLVWDLTVLGWEVNYKEEFVPADEGSYTIIIQKGKKMGSQEEPVRNSSSTMNQGRLC
ncbi:Patellin-4 [Vitis vinifera]|uniref:Patellin-4 n=1 Tax=Vitis vinifera TaxID=29760 RepID=A0A438DZE1_VITVI|nr:Patellin-4 [Vitis vinifera]